MKTVYEILQKKGDEVWAVGPSDTIYGALELMREKNTGAVLVVETDILLGIFSERDYARKVVLEGKASRTTAVRDAMTTKVAYVRPHQTVEECMALMTEKRIRHLPVFEGEKLIGVISIGDVVKVVISEKEFLIDQLTSYISGP